MECSGAHLYTVEIQQGDRPFEVTQEHNKYHLQLRTYHELWHKEAALNLLINRLPPEAKYIAWIDADITFVNNRWVQETLQFLQHYEVVQLFSHAQDVCENFEPVKDPTKGMQILPSMLYKVVNGLGWDKKAGLAYGLNIDFGHPGYAWAARRSAIDTFGGLIDWSICGANDRHMAFGLIGRIAETVHPMMNFAFGNAMEVWQQRALRLNQNIGYVPGLICHHWHGNKVNRRYMDRWKILTDNSFDPYMDIYRDAQGLYQLSPNKPRLRDDLRQYFTQRNEDAPFTK